MKLEPQHCRGLSFVVSGAKLELNIVSYFYQKAPSQGAFWSMDTRNMSEVEKQIKSYERKFMLLDAKKHRTLLEEYEYKFVLLVLELYWNGELETDLPIDDSESVR